MITTRAATDFFAPIYKQGLEFVESNPPIKALQAVQQTPLSSGQMRAIKKLTPDQRFNLHRVFTNVAENCLAAASQIRPAINKDSIKLFNDKIAPFLQKLDVAGLGTTWKYGQGKLKNKPEIDGHKYEVSFSKDDSGRYSYTFDLRDIGRDREFFIFVEQGQKKGLVNCISAASHSNTIGIPQELTKVITNMIDRLYESKKK